MSILEDWMNVLLKSPDDSPLTKELDSWKQFNESLKSGDYIKQIPFEESGMGKQLEELQKMRQELDNYIAEYRAYQAAAEQREKASEKRGFRRGILSSTIAAIIGGIVIYYWPVIVSFLANLFQKSPPP